MLTGRCSQKGVVPLSAAVQLLESPAKAKAKAWTLLWPVVGDMFASAGVKEGVRR